MSRSGTLILLGMFAAMATPVAAQQWEVHQGLAGSVGAADAYGAGAGPVFGVEPGRLAYVGLRWLIYAGSTPAAGTGPATTQVRNRVHTLTLDLALVIPAGGVGILPGVGIGAAFFRQDTIAAGGSDWNTAKTTEFLVTPGIAVQIPLGRMAIIPEVQYALSPHPRVVYPFEPSGPLLSVRVVYTFETNRLRQ